MSFCIKIDMERGNMASDRNPVRVLFHARIEEISKLPVLTDDGMYKFCIIFRCGIRLVQYTQFNYTLVRAWLVWCL